MGKYTCTHAAVDLVVRIFTLQIIFAEWITSIKKEMCVHRNTCSNILNKQTIVTVNLDEYEHL